VGLVWFLPLHFGWGSAPDPAGGAYSAPSDSLAGLRGLLLRGGKGTGKGKGKGGDGKGEGEWRGREGEGTRPHPFTPPNPYFWISPCFVSLNILLSHSRSFEITLLSRACASPY